MSRFNVGQRQPARPFGVALALRQPRSQIYSHMDGYDVHSEFAARGRLACGRGEHRRDADGELDTQRKPKCVTGPETTSRDTMGLDCQPQAALLCQPAGCKLEAPYSLPCLTTHTLKNSASLPLERSSARL